MNEPILEFLIQHLMSIKTIPNQWSAQEIKEFCEFASLNWAVHILKNPQKEQRRSIFNNILPKKSPSTSAEFKINLLDVCIMQFDQIEKYCQNQQVAQLISNSDITLYFQIQKLRIWSFILLQYNENHEELRKYYNQRTSFGYTHLKCKSCHAEIQCSCFLLRSIVQKIIMFTRNICVVAKDQAKDFLNILGEDDVDELAQQRQLNRRQGQIYISNNILSLIHHNLFYLPNQNPLQWDDEDLSLLLQIIKQEHQLDNLAYFQVDGFVVLLFINTPFTYT